MATDKVLAGPAFLGTSIANVVAAPSSTVVNTIRHIHLANVTPASVKFRLFFGATAGEAAGTQLFFDKPVSAYDVYDHYCQLPQKSTDYLSGKANVANAIVITVTGDQEIVP